MIPLINDEPWYVIEHRARGIAISLNSGRGQNTTEEMVYASTGDPFLVDHTVVEVARRVHRIYQTYDPVSHSSDFVFYQAGYNRLEEHLGKHDGALIPHTLPLLLDQRHAPVDLRTQHDSNTPTYTSAVYGVLLWMAEHDAMIPLLDVLQPLVEAYTDGLYFLPGLGYDETAVTVQRWLQLAILLSLHHAVLHSEHDTSMPFSWREPMLWDHMRALLHPSPAMERLFAFAEQDVKDEALYQMEVEEL